MLLPPRSALGAAPQRLASALLRNPHVLLLAQYPLRGTASVARLSAIHFQGCFIRQVSRNTLISGCRLSWPPPCCQDETTPFVVSHQPASRHLGCAFGSSRIASSAYQKWPTKRVYSGGDIERIVRISPHAPISSLRIGQEHSVPDASNHSLYQMQLLPCTPAILRETSEETSY